MKFSNSVSDFSAYMTIHSGPIQDVIDDYEYAKFLYCADVFKHKMDVLEQAGALDQMMQYRCLEALQHAQYTQTYLKVMHYNRLLDQAIDKLA